MRINLEINKKISGSLPVKFLKEVIRDTIRRSNCSFLDSRKITISLALVSEEEIKKINRKYRSQNTVTDILSFANYESKKDIMEVKSNDIFLGELIVCCSYIKKSAKIDGISFREEMACVISHGVLHLLGFSHGKEMFSIQDKVSGDAFLKSKNPKLKLKRSYVKI